MSNSAPLQQYYEARRASGFEVKQMIEELDPVDNAVEITHLSMEVLTPPLLGYLGYSAGFARTLGNPAVAHRIWRNGEGDQIVASARRDVDTLAFFGLFMRYGFGTDKAQGIYDRVQDIHRTVKGIGNETQVHVLGMLIFDQERFAKNYGHEWFSDKENEARFHFWVGVGKAMRLKDVPETREEFLTWIDNYEKRWFEPSEAAHESFKGLINGVSEYVPLPLRPAVRELLIEGTSAEVRELCLFDNPLPVGKFAMNPIVKVLATARLGAFHRLDASWVTSFSRLGEDPDISAMGYQPKA